MTDQVGAATPEDTARQIVRCLEGGYRMTLEAPDGMTVTMIPAKAALAAWNTRTPDIDWQPDNIDIYRIIKKSGARSHADIAKAIASAITLDTPPHSG